MVKYFAVIAFWLAASLAGAAGVKEGMSRAQVEAELGRPLSALVRGDTTVLRYPNDGRVELVADRLTLAVRVRHADDAPAAEAVVVPSVPVSAEEEKAAKVAAAEAVRREQAEAKAEAAAQAQWERANAEAQRQVEAAVERLTTEREAGPAAAHAVLHEPAEEFWLLIGVAGLVQVAVSMVILKLAFGWADVHAEWGQMVWPAMAGMLGGALVRVVAYAGWGVTECFHVDDAVSYVALFVTLMKTTHACTWQRAVGVAAAAKLMSIVVWVFLGVAISRMLFG